jgi:hypothetical protein
VGIMVEGIIVGVLVGRLVVGSSSSGWVGDGIGIDVEVVGEEGASCGWDEGGATEGIELGLSLLGKGDDGAPDNKKVDPIIECEYESP